MYNLLEYSKNYEKTSRSLFNYYRDEPSEAEIASDNGGRLEDYCRKIS